MSSINEIIADFLKVLGHSTRLDIINYLLSSGKKSVNEITDAMGQSQSTISQHLKILTNADILEYEKDGIKNMYHVKYDDIHKLLLHIKNFITKQVNEDINGITEANIADTLGS
jgi:ArsR family transcriptional regulator